MKRFLLTICCIVGVLYINPKTVLQSEGYRNIIIVDIDRQDNVCGIKTPIGIKFRAINKKDQIVNGTVCLVPFGLSYVSPFNKTIRGKL